MGIWEKILNMLQIPHTKYRMRKKNRILNFHDYDIEVDHSKIDRVFTEKSFRLVEEAEKWLHVRENGSNRGDEVERFQKEVDGISSGEPWCFKGDVEILTENGWVRFDKLSTGAKVAQVNEDRSVSFVIPDSLIKKTYTGELYNVKQRNLNFTCDPEHRFYGRWNSSKNYRLRPIKNLTSNLSIPSVYSSSIGLEWSDHDLELFAAYLSDGFFKKTSGKTKNPKDRIEIQVSKQRKIDRLDNLNYVGKHTASKVYGKSKKPLTTYVFKIPQCFYDFVDVKTKTLDFKFSLMLSVDECKRFIDFYSRFDGSQKKNSIILFSSDLNIKDCLITIGCLAGYHPNVSSCASPVSGRLCYSIIMCPNKNTRTIREKDIIVENTADMDLFCVSVNSGMILVRDKNGNPFMTGNCMAFVQFCINEVDRQYEKEFGFSHLMNWIYETEHCLTCWNRSPRAARTEDLHPGLIVIWQYWKDGKQTTSGHCGVLKDITEDGRIITIEGNTSDDEAIVREGDGVFLKTRLLKYDGNFRIKGFLKPWDGSFIF